jgi:Spy/CpxP family protein refolding chaperone
MKTKKRITVSLFALMMAAMVMAQPGQRMGTKQGAQTSGMRQTQICEQIPNITDEQKAKIESLRVTHLKQMQTWQNKQGELKARQRTLETAEKPDMKAIHANIDEMSKNQTIMAKASAEHRQQIRQLLNDEQKLWFDTHSRKQGSWGMARHNRKGGGDRGQNR